MVSIDFSWVQEIEFAREASNVRDFSVIESVNLAKEQKITRP